MISHMSSLFFANDSAIGFNDHKWPQNATPHLCNLFSDCTGMIPNTVKTETMSCHPGAVLGWYTIKTMHVVMKVPEELIPREKEGKLCVLLPLVAKPWHWAPYNPTYVRNMEWILADQSLLNQ